VAPQLGVAVRTMAGGSIMEDFDGDGLLDLITSSTGHHENINYFQNQGDGSFTDRTHSAGLSGLTGGLNLAHADYNNDGLLDVLVARGAWRGFMPANGDAPNSLLRNNGDGTFSDVTEESGLLSFHPTQVAVWADFDNDGWIDLFLGNESQVGDPHPIELYRNNKGTFEEVSAEVGLSVSGMVKGAAQVGKLYSGEITTTTDLRTSTFHGTVNLISCTVIAVDKAPAAYLRSWVPAPA